MKVSSTFLRSKVGQRVLLLFLSCALLPVTILSVISFYEVSSQLRQKSQEQLARASKAQGMEIYERLTVLDSDLEALSGQINQHSSVTTKEILEKHFQGVTMFASDGREQFRWGTAPLPPQLSAAETRHLRSGHALLQVGVCGNHTVNCISMVRSVDDGHGKSSTLVAEVSPEYLFTPQNLPAGVQFCAFSSAGSVIFCSDDSMSGAKAPVPFNRASGLAQVQSRGTLYDVAYWQLLVRPTFLEDSWTIVAGQEHADAVAPILRFRKGFSLVILLSLWIVLFFSMVQIRRTLVPLEKLREGTDKIGSGQFETRVDVHSGDEFEGLAGSFNRMATQLGKQFLTLKTINEIDEAIFASLDRETMVDDVLARMPTLLAGDCFAVCVFDDTLSVAWVRFRDVTSGQVNTSTTEVSEADWLQLQCNSAGFLLAGEERIPEYLHPLSQGGMRFFAVLPIKVDDGIHAALACARKAAPVASGEMHEARPVADQLAVAFSHVRLINALEQLHWGTLTALARAIDAKSQWTAGHSERVTKLAVDIGRHMGLSARDLRIMQMGGLLHDVGKIGTPPSVLDKPGKLDADEMSVMRDHVRTGVRILEPIPGFREALPIVSQHHEWFNGKGYPEGLAGKEISLYARIFAIADCYDALTSDRPYRNGLPPEQCIEMIREKSGVQFDPDVIDVFLRMMAEKSQPKQMAACMGQPV